MKAQPKKPAPGRNGFNYRQQYGVVVICLDEAEQIAVYQTLKAQGYKLRVVTV